MKLYAKLILALVIALNFVGCAVVIHSNLGYNISDNDRSTMDDMVLKQNYDTKVTSKKREKIR